jgi:hypothetical protein
MAADSETMTADYQSPADLKTADDLTRRRKQLQDGRRDDTRDWALNRAFFNNQQWAFYNKINGRVENLPSEDGEKPRYIVRLVSNQILPGVMAYVAMLTKTKPTIYATPDSSDNADRKAAEMGQRLFEYWWHEMGLESKLQKALYHSTLSRGYWKITWDPYAGKPMRFTINPQTGEPITQERLRDLFVAELRNAGLPPDAFDQQVALGDIRVEPMKGEDVWLSPGATCPEDAEYAICRHSMTPEEVFTRYGKKVSPDAKSEDPEDQAQPFGQIRVESKPTNMMKNVFVGYFKPSRSQPKGRYVVWMESPSMILVDTPWELPFQDLPLVGWPGQGYADTPVVTAARPLQKELNRTLSQIVMHKNLTVKPQLIYPTGSLLGKLTSEPGVGVAYNPVAGLKPEWRDMPALPAYVFEHLSGIQQRLDRLFNLQAVSRGDLPNSQVEAGVAIDLLQEAAVDQVVPVIKRIEHCLSHAGMLMAKLAQEYYIEPRLLKIKGPSGSNQVQHFMAADLQGGFTFHAEAGSGIPRTRAGRLMRIEKLINLGVMSPQQAAKEMDLGDMRSITEGMAQDEDHALREQDKILNGIPTNLQAYQSYMSALQAGFNPETGEPLQQEQEVQMLAQKAMVMPTPYENVGIHLEVHRKYLTSGEFETLPEPVQAMYLIHYQLTQQQAAQQTPQVQPQPIRTSLQLKGTVGPTAAAEILRNSGVSGATPETMAEQPLETEVYDSVDKMDQGSAGNNPLDPIEQAVALQQAEDMHQVKMAEATAKAGLAIKRVEQSDFRPKPPAGKK